MIASIVAHVLEHEPVLLGHAASILSHTLTHEGGVEAPLEVPSSSTKTLPPHAARNKANEMASARFTSCNVPARSAGRHGSPVRSLGAWTTAW